MTTNSFVWNRRGTTDALDLCALLPNLTYVPGSVSSGAVLSEGLMSGVPIGAGRSASINRLALEVTTIGTSGALVRAGLYAYNLKTDTLTLLVDAGMASGESTGLKTFDVSVPVSYGQILVPMAVAQGGAGTPASIRMCGTAPPMSIGIFNGLTALQNSLVGFNLAGVTGALPATISNPSAAGGNSAARVAIRAA